MGSVLNFSRQADKATFVPDPRELTQIERARGGDAAAWSQLYHEHFQRILKYVAYLAGDVQAAEDLVQETFARAYVGLTRFEPHAPFVGWLRGIALNVVRRHWRSQRRGDQAMAHLEWMRQGAAVGEPDPEGAHLRRQRAEVLLAILETLPESLREAYVLSDMHEMSAVEAAAELGLTPGNLRVRATRARARIRDELIRLGWVVEAAPKQRKEGDDGAR